MTKSLLTSVFPAVKWDYCEILQINNPAAVPKQQMEAMFIARGIVFWVFLFLPVVLKSSAVGHASMIPSSSLTFFSNNI